MAAGGRGGGGLVYINSGLFVQLFGCDSVADSYKCIDPYVSFPFQKLSFEAVQLKSNREHLQITFFRQLYTLS